MLHSFLLSIKINSKCQNEKYKWNYITKVGATNSNNNTRLVSRKSRRFCASTKVYILKGQNEISINKSATKSNKSHFTVSCLCRQLEYPGQLHVLRLAGLQTY